MIRRGEPGVIKTSTSMSYPTAPCLVERLPDGGRNKELLMTITEGRNRQIRLMLQKLGYIVTNLERISFSNIGLDGLEKEGNFAPLNEEELACLFE